MRLTPLLAPLLLIALNASASEWGISSSFLLAKEQVRAGDGASNGPLFEDRQLALWLHWYHPLGESWAIGPFAHYEHGARRMCAYATNASGAPAPASCHSGTSNDFWLGPAARYRWESLFFEAQYILFGRRTDSAYASLAAPEAGSTTYSTHPFKAWVLTPGARVPLTESIDLLLKIEYRFLYYSSRGGRDLPGDQLYGNQAIRPQIGLSGRF